MSHICIKRGASLSETLNFTTGGAATVLTGLTMTAMVRTPEGQLVATITPVATSTPGQATIYVQDTSGWPEGLLAMDVEISAAGQPTVISQTFGIQVEPAETWTVPPQAPFDEVTS